MNSYSISYTPFTITWFSYFYTTKFIPKDNKACCTLRAFSRFTVVKDKDLLP